MRSVPEHSDAWKSRFFTTFDSADPYPVPPRDAIHVGGNSLGDTAGIEGFFPATVLGGFPTQTRNSLGRFKTYGKQGIPLTEIEDNRISPVTDSPRFTVSEVSSL